MSLLCLQVAEPSSNGKQAEAVQSHTLLHYSVLKNLAELSQKRNDLNSALEYYMEVVFCNTNSGLLTSTSLCYKKYLKLDNAQLFKVSEVRCNCI